MKALYTIMYSKNVRDIAHESVGRTDWEARVLSSPPGNRRYGLYL